LRPGFSASQRDAASSALSLLGDIEPLFRNLARVLEFDQSTEIPPQFAELVRSVALAAPGAKVTRPPFLRFAARLPAAHSPSDFSSLARDVWGDNVPVKAAQIAWNCFPDLPPFDLSLSHVQLPDWYIFRLPVSFTDFFAAGCGGEAILGLVGGANSFIVRCLTCGEALTIDREKTHSFLSHVGCGRLGLVLLGPAAPLAVAAFPTKFSVIRLQALYLTAQGGEDIGLTSGAPLVLCEERRRALARRMLSGYFTFLEDPSYPRAADE
jgi:hypothetical protein